jgi:hypothetical protein
MLESDPQLAACSNQIDQLAKSAITTTAKKTNTKQLRTRTKVSANGYAHVTSWAIIASLSPKPAGRCIVQNFDRQFVFQQGDAGRCEGYSDVIIRVARGRLRQPFFATLWNNAASALFDR